MSEYDILLTYNTYAPIALHICAVTFFVLTGTITNGIIIYTHTKKHNIGETDIYITALASVGLFSCLVVCPQYPFWGAYIEEYKKNNPFALRQLMISSGIILYLHLGLLTAIALIHLLSSDPLLISHHLCVPRE